MKKIYLMGAGIFIGLSAQAQINVVPNASFQVLPEKDSPLVRKNTAENTQKGAETEIYWEESFENGFESANGNWTVSGANGNLWTYIGPGQMPVNEDDPIDDINPAYEQRLPNFAPVDLTLLSETELDGFMFLDADRWNSTRTPDNPGGTLTTNTLEAVLLSPAIDLSGVGTTSMRVQYTQALRLCCAGGAQTEFAISTDDGETWTPFNAYTQPVNGVINGEEYFQNVSSLLEAATDLTAIRLRWTFPPTANVTHYYWLLDDVRFTSIPDNNLIVRDNSFDDHLIEIDNPNGTYADYIETLEYSNYDTRQLRPFTLTVDVENAGGQTQTNVVAEVTITGPNGILPNMPLVSDPVDIASGERVFITIPDYELPAADPGQYTVEFVVVADQADVTPEDNVGVVKTFNIEDGFMANDRNLYTSFYGINENAIWISRMAFVDDGNQVELPQYIIGMEWALAGTETAPSTVGEILFYNISRGSLTEAEGPENEIERYFGEDELAYEIAEEDLTTAGDPVWISREFPEPVQLVFGQIMQPEIHLPATGGGVVATMACTNQQEVAVGGIFDGNEAGGTWFSMGTNTPLMRLIITDVIGVTDVENAPGVEVSQNMPNPFQEMSIININLEEARNISFELRDITGKLILSDDMGRLPAGTHRYQLNAGDLNSGAYLYSVVVDGAERVTRRMLVAR